MFALIISVIVLIGILIGIYFWFRSNTYSTLVSLMNRLKDDSSDPFENCNQIKGHMLLLQKEFKRLVDQAKDKDKVRSQIEDVLKRRVDPKIEGGQGVEFWINSKLLVITTRIGCVRKNTTDLVWDYVSVKAYVDKVMATIRPIMRNDFKSCEEFLQLHATMNSQMNKEFPRNLHDPASVHQIIEARMTKESVDEEYTNPLSKGTEFPEYLQHVHSKSCSA